MKRKNKKHLIIVWDSWHLIDNKILVLNQKILTHASSELTETVPVVAAIKKPQQHTYMCYSLIDYCNVVVEYYVGSLKINLDYCATNFKSNSQLFTRLVTLIITQEEVYIKNCKKNSWKREKMSGKTILQRIKVVCKF